MKMISKKVSNAKTGCFAMSAAQRAASANGKDAFFSNHKSIIRVQPTGMYSVGKIGDYGFCSRTAKIAANHDGVWIEA